jgi:hypothetical protein
MINRPGSTMMISDFVTDYFLALGEVKPYWAVTFFVIVVIRLVRASCNCYVVIIDVLMLLKLIKTEGGGVWCP